jgi:hypothetical protein
MKGDFTRDTFDRAKHFSSVLMQQGRVMLDADYNEQSAILLHYIRTLARDLIGPYAAPIENPGFFLDADTNGGGFTISAGRYYVDGILVENETDCTYVTQPNYRLAPDDDPVVRESKNGNGQLFWAYLDVWERHISSLEDDSIRETALGGPDTCTRSKVVWQVKALSIELRGKSSKEIRQLEAAKAQFQELSDKEPIDSSKRAETQQKIASIDEKIVALKGDKKPRCDMPLADLVTLSNARLAARVDPGRKSDDPCVTSPDSKYRGPENHLYRVEIHESGAEGEATFKWSRDNGSNATAWLGTDGDHIEVANTRGFTAGGWIELTDDRLDLAGKPGVLVKVVKVEGGRLTVDPETGPKTGTPLAWSTQLVNPNVRHWHQAQRGDIELQDGAVLITETTAKDEGWIDLEDGIQIRFEAGGEYRSGDYWLIPARVPTGKVEWPTEMRDGKEVAVLSPPKGIEHHYAPLGFMSWNDTGWEFRSCRCDFEPLSSCFARGSMAVGERLLRTGDWIKTAPAREQPKPTKAKRKKSTP